jgi:hypothetical protein
MDSHAVDPAAGRTPTQPTTEEPDEVSRLRERLAFYESFDQLIQENIGRAGELMRQAMDLRETASLEVAAARTEAERDRTADRVRYRSLFGEMLDEVTALQGQAERLARRLTDALDDVEAALPPGAPAVGAAAVAAEAAEAPAPAAGLDAEAIAQPNEDGEEPETGETPSPAIEATEALAAPAAVEAEPMVEGVVANAEPESTESRRLLAPQPASPTPAESAVEATRPAGDG